MTSPTPLKFLAPGWFSVVMGLCGLSLAWHRAHSVLGDMADGIALVVGGLAALVFAVLLGASIARALRYPAALADDLKHPVRHAFVAAFPVATLLLAAVGVALFGPHPALHVLWWLGSLAQLWTTVWVLDHWLAPVSKPLPGQGAGNTGLWPAVTPVLLIAVVGNVVAPLAGLPLGHEVWSAAQLGIGAFFWPIVLALVLVRRIAHSPLPDRILPSWFITIAPPAVIGVVLTQFEAPLPLALGMWGLALFFVLWVSPMVRRIAGQPFGVAFWGMSFPFAAFTTLTLRLAELQAGGAGNGALQTAGVLLLAITTMIVLWLGFATVRGLREGSLLAPEPIAIIQPVAA
jgi:tellurite resistance protein